MDQQEQAKFEGWAVVEQMGHNKYAGFVTTQVFGAAALFRIDVPELPERETRLTNQSYFDGQYLPIGSLVKVEATPAYTKLIGPSSIFAITPCSEALVRETLDRITQRPMIVLERPAKAALSAQQEDDEDNDPDFEDRELETDDVPY